MKTTTKTVLEPVGRLTGLRPYSVPRAGTCAVDLRLDANEGPALDVPRDVLASLTPEQLRRYPRAADLGARLADRVGVEPERIVVTNGGDDAIDRICRVALEPGRRLLLHTPTFEMIERSARLAAATASDSGVDRVTWIDGAFPVAAFIEAITPSTGLVSLVSPNNPTGCSIDLSAMLAVVRAAAEVGAVVMVDLAYVEFDEVDPTGALLAFPNVVMVRTCSKALGLAGLRVGYAIASAQIATWLRTVGGPYPVSTISLALAASRLDDEATTVAVVQRIRQERTELTSLLRELGAHPIESCANFVTAAFRNTAFTRSALASLGIGVRAFEATESAWAGSDEGDGFLRITLPGDPASFERLTDALRTIERPQAVLFDLDGVIADVTASYRAAIVATGATYGVTITARDIAEVKAAGNANNDWDVTCRLLAAAGVEAERDDVIDRFQSAYEGTPERPGLRERETMLVTPEWIERLATRYPLAVVTGRPREEAERFLSRFGIREWFGVIVAMEDGPPKPSPQPVQMALEQLGVGAAWMIGDTPDDVQAARAAGVVPIGVPAPSDAIDEAFDVLASAGAALVVRTAEELEERLP